MLLQFGRPEFEACGPFPIPSPLSLLSFLPLHCLNKGKNTKNRGYELPVFFYSALFSSSNDHHFYIKKHHNLQVIGYFLSCFWALSSERSVLIGVADCKLGSKRPLLWLANTCVCLTAYVLHRCTLLCFRLKPHKYSCQMICLTDKAIVTNPGHELLSVHH